MRGRREISLRRSLRPARDLVVPELKAALLVRHRPLEVRIGLRP
jgi:hypothetical protein